MTLVLTLGSRSQADNPFNSYNYCLNYFPVESVFWPSVTYIVENRKVEFEMTSRGQVDQSVNYLFERKNFRIFHSWSQKDRFLSEKNYVNLEMRSQGQG